MAPNYNIGLKKLHHLMFKKVDTNTFDVLLRGSFITKFNALPTKTRTMYLRKITSSMDSKGVTRDFFTGAESSEYSQQDVEHLERLMKARKFDKTEGKLVLNAIFNYTDKNKSALVQQHEFEKMLSEFTFDETIDIAIGLGVDIPTEQIVVNTFKSTLPDGKVNLNNKMITGTKIKGAVTKKAKSKKKPKKKPVVPKPKKVVQKKVRSPKKKIPPKTDNAVKAPVTVTSAISKDPDTIPKTDRSESHQMLRPKARLRIGVAPNFTMEPNHQKEKTSVTIPDPVASVATEFVAKKSEEPKVTLRTPLPQTMGTEHHHQQFGIRKEKWKPRGAGPQTVWDRKMWKQKQSVEQRYDESQKEKQRIYGMLVLGGVAVFILSQMLKERKQTHPHPPKKTPALPIVLHS